MTVKSDYLLYFSKIIAQPNGAPFARVEQLHPLSRTPGVLATKITTASPFHPFCVQIH